MVDGRLQRKNFFDCFVKLRRQKLQSTVQLSRCNSRSSSSLHIYSVNLQVPLVPIAYNNNHISSYMFLINTRIFVAQSFISYFMPHIRNIFMSNFCINEFCTKKTVPTATTNGNSQSYIAFGEKTYVTKKLYSNETSA